MLRTGRVYEYDPNLDVVAGAATIRDLNPARIRGIIDRAEQGDLAFALSAFHEMEQHDARLRAVAHTRRIALTGLDWEVVSAAEVKSNVSDKTLADEAAAYARETMEALDDCECGLEHLSTAIGPNLAVLEVEWDRGVPRSLQPIPHHRLTQDLQHGTDIRIITRDAPRGIVAEAPAFIVHIPHSKSISPVGASLLKAQAHLWLIKWLVLADWATFCELFGMPVRLGKFQRQATPEDKKIAVDMLQNMGTRAWALFSGGIDIEFLETNRGVQPYEAMINLVNREYSILWLGGNLTSDTTGGTGTFAAAEVQDQVREDLRDDDIRREGRTIREQLLKPMVTFGFPGRDAPTPYFRRIKPEITDKLKEAQLIGQAQQDGIKVPLDWAYKRLGIPKPQEDERGIVEPVLVSPSADQFEQGLGQGDF